jgi:hypothetical protein
MMVVDKEEAEDATQSWIGTGTVSTRDSSETTDDTLVWQPYLTAVRELRSTNQAATVIRSLVLKVCQQNVPIYNGFLELKDEVADTCGSAGATTNNALLEQILNTLNLFAVGTFADYQDKSPQSFYLPLQDGHVRKLQMLTVVSLVQDACYQRQRSISYAAIQQSLRHDKVERTLDILNATMEAGLIVGQLCSRTQTLILGGVSSSEGSTSMSVPPCRVVRDVSPESITSELLTQCQAWQSILQKTQLNRMGEHKQWIKQLQMHQDTVMAATHQQREVARSFLPVPKQQAGAKSGTAAKSEGSAEFAQPLDGDDMGSSGEVGDILAGESFRRQKRSRG